MDSFAGREFERTELLIGKEKQKILSQAMVAIFGLGGVGAFACEGLARSGLGNFILIDFDKINLTNINRQITAMRKTAGMDKSEAMKERIKEINPGAKVMICNDFLHADSIEKLMENIEAWKVDFFIEAIDSLGPKVKLIKKLVERKLPFISSMGAGGRTDPFMVKPGNLDEVKNCNLAKRIKKLLKKEKIDLSSIKVVYSTETGQKPEKREEWEEGDYRRGRVRGKMGSICFVPAVFGMYMAYLAFKHITENSRDKNF